MRIIPLVFLLLLGRLAAAQDDPRMLAPSNDTTDGAAPGVAAQAPYDSIRPGTISIHESERIKALMADYASKRQPLKGYRVQIFLGDRASAETVRRNFLQQHPGTPAYLSYLAPNFRVRVGDLRDRVSAEFLRESLKSEFPGLYIVPDDIEPPALRKAEGDGGN